MSRRIVAPLVVGWLIVGGFGAWAYAHDYYVYRGFGPPRNPPGVAAGRVVRVSFHSAALQAQRSYDIYLPPGYAPGRRFDVLYLLHGSPGAPLQFIDDSAVGVAMDTLIARHEIRPFLIVMPDGRDGTLLDDTEWADTPHGRYESFVLDVVRDVDHRWPTIADRDHRVLAGNSEGAYAAANLTLRHLSTFGAFESWSGYFRQTRTGVFARASAAQLAANSPIDLASRVHLGAPGRTLHAYLYGGAQDPDTRQLMPFARALRAAGATVETADPPGRHDWGLWRDWTPRMLRWAAAQMGATG